MAVTIMILCVFLSVILNIVTLQIGYLIGKKHYQETREDQYWDMCRQIAQYDDELSKYKARGPLYKILTRIELDKRYIAHYKFKHHYTMTPEEMKLVDDDERVNNLYKEAEEISNNAGDTKEEEK